jgi:type IV fimbrial biogenesis protein FimT
MLRSGFTLIEIMITMLIMSILLAVGVPAMRDFIIETRLSVAVNQFVAAATLARTEAIKRGRSVAICRSVNAESDAGRCVASAGAGDGRAGNDWGSGWIVMVPDENQVLLRQAALSKKTSVVGTNKKITYNGLGRPGASFSSLVFRHGGGVRIVCLSRSGRIRVLVGVPECK